MPITVNTRAVHVRTEGGDYDSIPAFMGNKAKIDQTIANGLQQISAAGRQVLDSIPADYSAISKDVDNLQTASKEAILHEETYEAQIVINVGYTVNTSGAVYANPHRAVTEKLRITNVNGFAFDDDLYEIKVGIYDKNNSYTGAIPAADFESCPATIMVPRGNLYARIIVKRKDDAVIAASEAAAIRSAIKRIHMTDTSLSMPCIPADAEVVGQRLDNLDERCDNIAPVLHGAPYTLVSGKYINYSTGAEATSSAFSCTGYIDIGGLSYIRYTRIASTSASNTGGMAFYDSDKNYIAGNRNILNAPAYAKTLSRIRVPENAVYARFTVDGSFELYDDEQYERSLLIQQEMAELGLHSAPVNDGAYNVVRKCRQLTDVRWTPAVDLPRLLSIGGKDVGGVFKAGVEYKGIPYGRTPSAIASRYNRNYLYTGLDINLETFVTAAANKDSIIGKESVFDKSNNRTLPYSAVCSTLTSYALYVSYHTTSTIPSIPGMTTIGKIVDGDAQMDLKRINVADVLNIHRDNGTGHTGIITDIVKDDNGSVAYIEVAEATTACDGLGSITGDTQGGVCRRKAYTADDFYTFWGAYTLYRYLFVHTVPYTKSPAVNVGSELDMRRIVTLPAMPYEGNLFRYKSGYIPNNAVKILISTDLYTHLRVLKDGLDVAGSPFEIGSAAYINVTEISQGSYEAWLCDVVDGEPTNGTKSMACSWRIDN